MISQLHQGEVLDVIQDVANIGGWLIDVKSQSLYWTRKTSDIYEVPANFEPTLEESIEFFLPEYRTAIALAIEKLQENGEPFSLQAQINTYHGQNKWVFVSAKVRRNSVSDEIESICGSIQDISHSMSELEHVNDQRQVLKTILDNMLEGLIVIDRMGKILLFNRAAEDIFGYKPKEVIGSKINMLMPQPDSQRHDKYMQNYLKTGQAKIIGIGRDVEAMRKNGQRFPISLSISEIELNRECHFLGTVRDISKEQETAKRIEWLSHYDEKTGLPNRNFLLNYLSSKDFNQGIAALTINIDQFSRIFLAFGLEESDKLLQVFSQRLVNLFGKNDFICRDMADRFWVVIAGKKSTDKLHLQKVVEELMRCIEQPFLINQSEHFVSTSIGVAVTQFPITSAALLSQAELALHDARQKGRGMYAIREEAISNKDTIVKAYQLEMELRSAIKQSRIECWLQPKVDVKQALSSAEVLVRWRGNENELIMPDLFIPVAENSGVMPLLGKVIIQKTAEMLEVIHAHLPQLTIAMNVSPAQFLQPNFCEELVSIFQNYQAPLDRLIIEITENLLIADTKMVNQTILALKKFGVKFSIDDFGTGYSNLKRIQDLPVTELKIDKSFTWQCAEPGSGQDLVQAIIAVAQSMNLDIVAEGVESEAHAKTLVTLGANYLQGYYFDKPMTFDAFRDKYLLTPPAF